MSAMTVFYYLFSNVVFTDNYVLATNSSGSYVLFSTVQKENGPRSFYPYFGLAYMGKNALIRIAVLKNSLYQV